MNVLRPKSTDQYRVLFESFGSGEQHQHLTAQVLRMTRPHLLTYDVFGVPGAMPIEIDLRDDILDISRCEVLRQLARQINTDATFGLTIETVERAPKERWRLSGCRIVDCHLDELALTESLGLLIRLRVEAKRIETSLGDEMIVILDVPTNC